MLSPLPEQDGGPARLSPLPERPLGVAKKEAAAPSTVSQDEGADGLREQARALFDLAGEQPLPELDHLDERGRRSILSRAAIRVDWDALRAVKAEVESGGAGVLKITTKGKGSLTAKIGRVIENWGGGYSLSGELAGHPEGAFMATVNGGSLVATIRTGDNIGLFEILPNPEGTHEIRELDLSSLPVCAGTDTALPATPSKPDDPAAAPAASGEPSAGDEEPAAADGEPVAADGEPVAADGEPVAADGETTEIDVMVVYTPAARVVLGGTSETVAAINHAVNETNAAFIASGVSASFRLVHAAEVNYTEVSLQDDLLNFAGKTDGHMDGVHALRDTHKADIVSLWTGINYGGRAFTLPSLSIPFEHLAFNVCGITANLTSASLVFAHECGHNMGCAHDAENAAGEGLYSYSYGWRWDGSDSVEYRSIMAYAPGIRVPRYSNPNVNYMGAPTGTSTADNARTINNSKATVADFRGGSPPTPTLSADPVSRNVPAAGGAFDFSVTASGTWSWGLAGGNGWVTIGEPGGQSGNQTFSYTVAANGGSARAATITLTSGDLTATHTINQAGATADDHGDSIATATLAGQNSTTAGSIEIAGDNDYFRINVTEPGVLTVKTTGTTDTAGHLLDASGAELAFDDNSSSGSNFQISRAMEAETCYVRVRCSNAGDTGSYQLVATFVPSSANRQLLTLTRIVPVNQSATPDRVGTLALKAAPSKNATKLTKGPAPQTSDVLPGTSVTVTATAKAWYLFSHWTGLPDGALVTSNVVTFIMPAADVPGVTAVFIETPLVAWGGTKPVFQGLLRPSGGASAGNATVGLLTGAVVASKGSFSGKVLMDGKITACRGVLQGNGSVWFQRGKALSATLPLQDNTVADKILSLAWTGNDLDAEVNAPGGAVSTGLARPALYRNQAGAHVPAELLNRSKGKQGYYTLALPTREPASPAQAATYPQGTGHAAITLARAGTLRLAGVLADGTRITASSFLAAGNTSPVFVPLTTPGAKASVKGGSVLGTLVFASAPPDSDVTGADWQWFRPAVVEGKKPATQIYTAGWPEGIALDPVGALYDSTRTVQDALGMGDADPAGGNARLRFVDGKLSPAVVVTNFNVNGGRVIKIPANDKSFTLRFTAGTGLLRGTFTPNWSDQARKLPAFQGVLLQKGGNKGGVGFFLSNRLNDTDPESGGVVLDAP